MSNDWGNDQPIYRQLRDKVAALIMEGVIKEGDFVPSVRQVSAEQQVNHITVAKSYQELVDEGVLIMQRGRGMMVLEGARETLIEAERAKFEQVEVPALQARLAHLGISHSQLVEALKQVQDDNEGS